MPPGIYFPFLYVGIMLMPLFFERTFAFFWAGVWGIVMGAVSHNNLFFHVCVYSAAVAAVAVSVRQLQTRILAYGVASLAASFVYIIAVMVFGAYTVSGVISTFVLICGTGFGTAYLLGKIIPPEYD